ncbi:MAG: glycosyltransferase [Planctomycetota bacterium]
MPSPRISVVIPNFNYARFLPKAIRSVLNQSLSAHEIVVVDDGSTDNSREVIASFGDDVRSIFQPNGGLASAVNEGTLAAGGDWVALLDADDVWHPDKLAAVAENIELYPDAALVAHAVEKIDIDGEPLGTTWPLAMPSGNIARQAARCGGHWFSPPTSGLCFRRSLLQDIGPVPDGLFPDEYLPYVVAQLAPVATINRPLSYWRMHDANMSRELTGVSLKRFERSLRRFRQNNHAVGDTLARLGCDRRLSLDHLWPYQLLRSRAEDGVSPARLIRLGLWHNADPSWARRSKSVIKNLLKIYISDRRQLRRCGNGVMS